MEITQGISLHSYPYVKLAKTPCFSYYLLRFSSTKLENKREEQVLPSSGGGGGSNNVYIYIYIYTYICKCNNDKIK
jgi:hypothetical protein